MIDYDALREALSANSGVVGPVAWSFKAIDTEF